MGQEAVEAGQRTGTSAGLHVRAWIVRKAQ